MIQITDQALMKLEAVLGQAPGKCLRVAIKGGGCAGFSYDFLMEDMAGIEESDERIAAGKATVVVDPISRPYLEGAILDYESGLMGSQFVFRNPNVKASCGCGHSFTV